MTRHSTAWHSTARHSTARHSTARHSTARHSTARHSTARHSTARHSTARHSTARHSTARHSTARHSTARHSTAQHSTAPPPGFTTQDVSSSARSTSTQNNPNCWCTCQERHHILPCEVHQRQDGARISSQPHPSKVPSGRCMW